MDAAEVVHAPVDVLKSAVDDTQSDAQMETPEAIHSNIADPGISCDSFKVPGLELMLTSPVEESRPVDVAVVPSNSNDETGLPISPNTSRSSEAKVMTPAGTVGAPIDAEVVEKEATARVMVANESETSSEQETHKEDVKVVQQETVAAMPQPASTEPTPEVVSTPSPGKKTKVEKKHVVVRITIINDSFASDEVLSEVQAFLTLQIVENRCSSHTKEIHEFIESLTVQIVENRCSSHTKEIHEFIENHLNEKQQKRYIAPLLERITQHLTQEAKGEEISVDLQSNICLIEQMFLALGRRSPLQDMYTAEEEEMLDLLFHSNSSDNLFINT
ncbi:hypothetical protein PHMEG_0006896 [Phytophthora megakarya]|uniref:Uncharacterized protein n=1 Tax=Phytophthora megakarya TaxID=4795 RepID=A0A225WNQ2_9STRA|nr:hypothetical protein PHMEG_0006896 [Phytophthora megakarya]